MYVRQFLSFKELDSIKRNAGDQDVGRGDQALHYNLRGPLYPDGIDLQFGRYRVDTSMFGLLE